MIRCSAWTTKFELGLSERIIAHSPREEHTTLVLRRGSEGQPGADPAGKGLPDAEQRPRPLQVVVVNVMRLVVDDHHVLKRLDALQHGALVQGCQVLLRLRAKRGRDWVLRLPLRVALIELLNVGQEQVAGGVGLGSLAAHDNFERKGTAPLGRKQRQLAEYPVRAEVLLQSLVNDHVRRDDQEVGRHLRALHHPSVEVRPSDCHRHDPGLPGAGRHLGGVTSEVLRRQVLLAHGLV